MALPFPSSSPVEWTEEDGAFFRGVFDGSPENDFTITWNQTDLKSTMSASFDNEETFTTTLEVTGESTELVTDLQENDIICVRGAGQGHPGNKHYHYMIQSNKKIYDTMTTEDKEAFSEQIWASLRDERGTRFLKPTEHNPNMYEVLNHERSVRKILFALRDCRLKGKLKVSSAAAESKQKSQGKHTKRKLGFGAVEEECSRKPKFFDDEAAIEITKLYENNVLMEEMKKSWSNDFEAKKVLFEKHLLHRYKAAAVQGISPKTFTSRLVNVLLQEIHDSHNMSVSSLAEHVRVTASKSSQESKNG
ncbi:hypothetical protein HJC23_004305 [Cyclotella cryptica]|uniref:DUF6824 domain-containing protein n=1 Tax=Cyclotella cryptica TaxID=29204 RepID=A0ABD3Q3X2_9STRA|eukprot:CCRYP_008921-RA/>CCRYP_008921-RA protein AED:0.14 eAED:0.14 QI:0/0.5/0/1/1/1/3/0/304